MVFHQVCISSCVHVHIYHCLFIWYVLVIGRASVVSTGPLTVLSLLPSVILSGSAWIAKKICLKPDPESNTSSDTNADLELTNPVGSAVNLQDHDQPPTHPRSDTMV